MSKTLRIGGGGGFWGDTEHGAVQLVERGDIDVLIMDYLAEITMSLLARARARRPEAGYVPDFIEALAPVLHDIKARGIRVISNAGGMNPPAAAKALRERADAMGVDLRIAVVTGDDLMPSIEALRERGAVSYTHLTLPTILRV